MQTLILTSVLIGFAPAPVYRERQVTTKEQEVRLKSEEMEIQAAWEELHDCRPGREIPKEDRKVRFRERSRRSAERLSQLFVAIPTTSALRSKVGMRAAQGWEEAGEIKEAIACYEDLANKASEPRYRVFGLLYAMDHYKHEGNGEAFDRAKSRATSLRGSLSSRDSGLFQVFIRDLEKR